MSSGSGKLAKAALAAVASAATAFFAKKIYDRIKNKTFSRSAEVDSGRGLDEVADDSDFVGFPEPALIRDRDLRSALLEADDLGGISFAEAEDSSRQVEGARPPGIEEFVGSRFVRNLIHFTPVTKLVHIAEEGLLSNSEVRRLNRPVLDGLRMDGLDDHICVSISFPNYRMFHRYSLNSKRDWCVLLIDPSLLWRRDCLFYPFNAASSKLSSLPRQAFQGLSALEAMFAAEVDGVARSTAIALNMTTSPQAEVLIPGVIPPPFISRVHFFDAETQCRYLPLLRAAGVSTAVSSEYFLPRSDWEQWRLVPS